MEEQKKENIQPHPDLDVKETVCQDVKGDLKIQNKDTNVVKSQSDGQCNNQDNNETKETAGNPPKDELIDEKTDEKCEEQNEIPEDNKSVEDTEKESDKLDSELSQEETNQEKGDTNKLDTEPSEIKTVNNMDNKPVNKEPSVDTEKPEDKCTPEIENIEEDMCVDDQEKSFDSPPRMPGRGKKRGRSSDVEEGTVPKKRATTTEKEDKKVKVSHSSHPNPKVTGVVLTLGEGDVGQLGLGEDIIERGRPALVKMDDKFKQACAGGMHTVCLTNTGKIYTFGCNDESALGRDTSEEGSETYPALLNLPYKVLQITAGDSHTAILTDDGHVYAWGNFRDANGSMGLTSGGISKDPLEMLPGQTVVKIASGGDHLLCLTDKGEIFSGGCAEQGQLGRVAECFAGRGGRKGLDSILKMGPVRCKKHGGRKRAKFSDIWAGQYVSYAKEEDTGEIYSWGLNNYFQLGFDDMENRFIPEWVESFNKHPKKWIKICGGQHHAVLLDEDGKVFTIGRAEYGRLGLGENCGERKEPCLVSKLSDKRIVDIAAGQSVSFALADDGTAYSWGMGTSKQLGTGEEEDEWEPVQIKGKQLETRDVISISGGGQHTVLLAKDKS